MHEELKLKCQIYPYPLTEDGWLATSGPILPREEDIPIVINNHDLQIYHAGEMILFNKDVVRKLLELINKDRS